MAAHIIILLCAHRSRVVNIVAERRRYYPAEVDRCPPNSTYRGPSKIWIPTLKVTRNHIRNDTVRSGIPMTSVTVPAISVKKRNYFILPIFNAFTDANAVSAQKTRMMGPKKMMMPSFRTIQTCDPDRRTDRGICRSYDPFINLRVLTCCIAVRYEAVLQDANYLY